MATPTSPEIEVKLLAEISMVLGIDPGTMQPGDPLHTLGMDSLSLVEILVFIEKTYSLNLMESGVSQEDFQTVQTLAGRIANELRR